MATDVRNRDVRATINYLADPHSSDPLRWLQYYVNDKSRSTMRSEPHRVMIRDARPLNDQLDLDREGFKMVWHHTAVTNFRDPDEVAQFQPRELEQLVQKLTGAAATFCVGPQLRFAAGSPDADHAFAITRGVDTRPAGFVHGDLTDESIHWMAETWKDVRLSNYPRFACYNVWRAITPPPQDMPLALCDVQTVDADDSVDALAVLDPPDMHPQVIRTITTGFRPNARHRWYYFPDMTLDEVAIFKSYDSDRARASNIPHTAFRDPGCPAGAPPRGSAEARIIAVFK